MAEPAIKIHNNLQLMFDQEHVALFPTGTVSTKSLTRLIARPGSRPLRGDITLIERLELTGRRGQLLSQPTTVPSES